MGYLKIIGKRVGHAISDSIPFRQIRGAKATPVFDDLHPTSKADAFMKSGENVLPKRLQNILDGLGPNERRSREFLTELYSVGSDKFDYIYNHKIFGGKIPYFNDKEFIEAVKQMPEQELKKTFDEIEDLYKTLPEVSYDYNKVTGKLIYQPQTPNQVNLAQLTILKSHNKKLYEYILNNPNKEEVSDLLKTFANKLNGSTFKTLTLPQINQITRKGRTCTLNFKNTEDQITNVEGYGAMGRYVESSDMFYQNPDDIRKLNKYLSHNTITEPFTAFRAEKDTGMFSTIILDKNMSRKVKLLILRNFFKAKKAKVNDYTGTYLKSSDKSNDLASFILGKKELTLADAMQAAKYGDKNFRLEVADLIKKSSIEDNRFKSLTFDNKFAESWKYSPNNNTGIVHNMSVDRGLHGTYSHGDNKQAEFILNNDKKVMNFQDVKYDPVSDTFYLNSSIKKA